MALVRHHHGFKRYAFSVCYDGLKCLGFSFQGAHENCITANGTDLRAVHSVEGKIRAALSALVDGYGRRKNSPWKSNECMDMDGSNFENFQVSSRTDRSVHALKNTFHLDIRMKDIQLSWEPQKLVRGLNFHLIRNARDETAKILQDCHGALPANLMRSPENDVRIIACKPAPLELLPNKHYNDGPPSSRSQPSHIAWNARFTATSRTYVYRILVHRLPIPQAHNDDADNSSHTSSQMEEYGFPFEAGRSWRIHCQNNFDLQAMTEAANKLTGTHDFTSFRGKGCYRSNPVTSIESIGIQATPFLSSFAFLRNEHDHNNHNNSNNNAEIITIAIKGNAFLYRQVRNLVGCLAHVGQGKTKPGEVESILLARDRSKAPQMAPAHGLYLVDVEHGDFNI